MLREVASGAEADRTQLPKAPAQLDAGDVLMVTRLDPLARTTRDLLDTLAAVAGKKAGFKSLGTYGPIPPQAHDRLMLTVLGGLAQFGAGWFAPRPAKAGRVPWHAA